jgi:hypothetical protein
MTPRPSRPCAKHGCPALVAGSTYCAEHTPTRKKDPEQAKHYGSSRWRKLSEIVRKQEPICAMCLERPSAVTDHIDGDWRNNDRENLRGLCRDCNARHTGKQHRWKRG